MRTSQERKAATEALIAKMTEVVAEADRERSRAAIIAARAESERRHGFRAGAGITWNRDLATRG